MKINSPEQIQNRRITHQPGEPRRRRIDTTVSPEEALASLKNAERIQAPLATRLRQDLGALSSDEAYRDDSLEELIASRQPTLLQRSQLRLANERQAALNALKGAGGISLIIGGLALGAYFNREPIQNAVDYTKGIPERTATAVKNTFSNIAEYIERPQQESLKDFTKKAQKFRAERGMP